MCRSIVRLFAVLLLCVGLETVICSYRGGFAVSKKRSLGLVVYVIDNGTTTQVCNAPRGKVVMQLPAGNGYKFEVETVHDGWWRLSDEQEVWSSVVFPYQGLAHKWVHYSSLGLSTRNPHGEVIALRVAPTEAAVTICVLQGEVQMHPLDFKGEWCKVQTFDKKYTGWLRKKWLSPHPVDRAS